MKYFLLIGGGCGFLLAFGSGLFAGNEITTVLRDGTVGCMVGALLMRGFSGAFTSSLSALAAQRCEELRKKADSKK
jgi:hypothetical protein